MHQQAFLGAGSPTGEEVPRPWTGKLFVVSPDEQWIAVVGREHTVEIWSAAQLRLWSTYYGHRAGLYNRRTSTVTEIVWIGNEQVLSRSQDGSVHLWYAHSAIHERTFVDAGQPGSAAGTSMQDFVRLVSVAEQSRWR